MEINKIKAYYTKNNKSVVTAIYYENTRGNNTGIEIISPIKNEYILNDIDGILLWREKSAGVIVKRTESHRGGDVLALNKKNRITEVKTKSAYLMALGFTGYDDEVYSCSVGALIKITSQSQALDIGTISLPRKISTINEDKKTITTQTKWDSHLQAFSDRIEFILGNEVDLKDSINKALNDTVLNAIKDDRT